MTNSPRPTPSAAECIAFSRRRDSQIRWLLAAHPVTADVLVGLGLFTRHRKALGRLRTLAERGDIARVGTVCRTPGRVEEVYCCWQPPAGQLLHEVDLTRLLLRFYASDVWRGPSVPDRVVLPDAVLAIRGVPYYLELDRGTMGVAQVEERFRKYESCPHFSLWVCSTPARVEALRQRAGGLRATALFTTWDEALAGPHRAIWRDASGQSVALPRQSGKTPLPESCVGVPASHTP